MPDETASPAEAAPSRAAGEASPAEAAPSRAAGEASPAEAAPSRAAGEASPAEAAPSRAAGEASPAEAAPSLLPVAGRARPERADAARNRARVLETARRLFAERGVEAVTMEEVAREAGVAKGTVFNRFGDRAGLSLALLDDHERDLQDRIVRGPPPLGPGAPPRDRLLAFLAALAELTFAHRDLLREVERASPAARYRTGAYQAWLQHTVLLLGDDDALRAHLLLAPLAADLVWHLAEDEGASFGDVVRAVQGLARKLVD